MEREKNMECATQSATCGVSVAFRVVLASDAAGIDSCATVLASLLWHTEGPVEARIFSWDVEPVTVWSGRLTLEVMRVPEELHWLSSCCPGGGGEVDWAAALVCCEDWDRALVVSSERLVVGDPLELFEMELGDSLVAARMWPGVNLGDIVLALESKFATNQADMVGHYRYFEGAVVVDLTAMRKAGTLERMFELHIGGMNGNEAFCAACGDRVVELDRRSVSISRWNEIGADTVVADFFGERTRESGDPLWQAHATTWQKLTCGAWCPVPFTEDEIDDRADVLQSLIVSNRLPGGPLRVLEIGGWDFERMLGATTRWMEAETDQWSVLFRAHLDKSALEKAIKRFGDSLADLASRTEILDGSSAEILAWLMTKEERWERMDVVIIHAPDRAEVFLTEVVMAWSLLRAGGVMVVHTDRTNAIPVAAEAFERALMGFLGTFAGGVARDIKENVVVVRKGTFRSLPQAGAAVPQSGTLQFADPLAVRKPTLIVQASGPRTGSTVLTNLLYGLVAPTSKVWFSADMAEIAPFHGAVGVVKTHELDLGRIAASYGDRFNLYFVCSERGTSIIDERYRHNANVLRVPSEDLLGTDSESLTRVVDGLHARLTKFLPPWVSLNKGSAVGRLRRMNDFYQTIKHLPFAYFDDFYHLHGSHRAHAAEQFPASADSPHRKEEPAMRIYFVSFADTKYAATLTRIRREAELMGVFDGVFGWNESDLSPAFWENHQGFISRNSRGFGYWIWKSQVVKQALELIPEGSFLFYADAGCSLNPAHARRIVEYCTMMASHPSQRLAFQLAPSYCDRRWTKRHTVLAMGFDKSEKLEEGQLMATVFGMRKVPLNQAFVEEFCAASQRYDLISDEQPEPNVAGFMEHRHDQSVWSILNKQADPPPMILPDETEVAGNPFHASRLKF